MKKVSKKMISAAAAVVLLLAGMLAAMTAFGVWNSALRKRDVSRLKLNTALDMIRFMEEEQTSAEKSFEKNLRNNVRFMADALREFVTDKGYTGPRLFEDGAVIEKKGTEILYPEGMQESLKIVTADMLDSALKGEMDFSFHTHLDAEEDAAAPDNGEEADEAADEEAEDIKYLKQEAGLTFAEISDGLYYMDWTTADEYLHFLDANSNIDSMLEIAETTLGGALIVADMDPSLGEMFLYNGSSYFPDCESLEEIGFTRKEIENEQMIMQLRGRPYVCVYGNMKGMNSSVIIYAEPLLHHVQRLLLRIGLITLLSLVIFVTVAVWLISVQQYVRGHALNEKETRQYYPGNLRKRAAMAGLSGAAAVLATAAILHSLAAIQTETIEGRATAKILFEQLWEAEQQRSEKARKEEEDWYVYYGKRIADLISKYPELGTREKLQDFCSILNIDFLMVFDESGKEAATNSDYTGFTMDMGLGKDSSDFRRLLHGVASIVHDPSEDQTTGLTRQMIGVKIPGPDGMEANGALIMALLPETTSGTRPDSEISEKLALITPYGKTYFTADEKTGEIIYSGDRSLIGSDIEDCGLSKDTLSDDYMDFAMFNDQRSYVITTGMRSSICYYVTRTSVLLTGAFTSGLFAAIIYLAAFFILQQVLLKGYTDEVFEKWTDPDGETDSGSGESGEENRTAAESGKKRRRFSASAGGRMKPFSLWNEKIPEEKAGMVFKASMLLLIVIFAVQLMNLSKMYAENDSLLGFILYGDWKRGLNLFAVCSILILIGSAFLVMEACRWMLALIADFSGSMGETICGLLYSFAQYISLFVVLYFGFTYLGFPTQGVLSSLGIVTLALSLGAKDLASDILAGIFIVFEEQFKVGDYVSIDGYRGRVLEIGVRSTKILGSGNDVKVINNSMIKNVINKSRNNSTCMTELRVAASESYSRIEALLEEELPKIGERNKEFLSGPRLAGIKESGTVPGLSDGGFYTLLIMAGCLEKDYYIVMNIMNRELRLLFEREHIETR